jgi:esterase/lipase superfamily enzyme
MGVDLEGLVAQPPASRRVSRIAAALARLSLAAACAGALLVAGCASRPLGDLIATSASAPGAETVDMIVATTRAPVTEPPGVMFGGDRAIGLAFADIAVSIPPDSARKIGEVQWPASPPGDPAHDFVTVRADRIDLKEARARLDERLAHMPGRHVLVFVHGYNTRFEEAVYRFAQVAHDTRADVLPVLFTWPSRGRPLEYFYDRESASYSRDALEAVLQGLAEDPRVGKISILAHSMGNFIAVEALRQMAIRNRAISPKIKDIMLAAPDIDVDVFRRQIAEIEANAKSPPVTLLVSQDDRALGLSQWVAGDEPRLGAIDPRREPYRGLLEKSHVQVVDLTQVASDDPANHSKFASDDVVRAIGARLATGQKLNDAKSSFGETIGSIAIGAAKTAGATAALAISTPIAIVDPATRETLPDQAAEIVNSASGSPQSSAGSTAP